MITSLLTQIAAVLCLMQSTPDLTVAMEKVVSDEVRATLYQASSVERSPVSGKEIAPGAMLVSGGDRHTDSFILQVCSSDDDHTCRVAWFMTHTVELPTRLGHEKRLAVYDVTLHDDAIWIAHTVNGEVRVDIVGPPHGPGAAKTSAVRLFQQIASNFDGGRICEDATFHTMGDELVLHIALRGNVHKEAWKITATEAKKIDEDENADAHDSSAAPLSPKVEPHMPFVAVPTYPASYLACAGAIAIGVSSRASESTAGTRMVISEGHAYRYADPISPGMAVTLRRVATAEPGTEESFNISSLQGTTFRGSAIAWDYADGALHYAAVAVANRQGAVDASLVRLSTDRLQEYRTGLDRRGDKWFFAERADERLCLLTGPLKRLDAHRIVDPNDPQPSFDLTYDGPNQYTLWLLADGLLQRWTYDLRAEKLAERSITMTAEFACAISGPIHVVKTAQGSMLLDGARGVHRIGDKGLTRIGLLKPPSADTVANQILHIRDHDAKQVCVLQRIEQELQSVEFIPETAEHINPFAIEMSSEKKAAILAVLNLQ